MARGQPPRSVRGFTRGAADFAQTVRSPAPAGRRVEAPVASPRVTGPGQTDQAGETAAISAVIVAYLGSPAEIKTSIESVNRQDRPPQEVLLVDNSPDGRHRSTAEATRATWLSAGRNLGFAGGVELAANRAGCEYLLLLNPDATAEQGCLRLLAEALDAEPQAAVAGAQVLLPDGRVNAGDNPIHLSGLCWSGNLGGNAEQGPPRETLAVSGAAIMVRTADFLALGGFHPAIFMYFEDTDLCWRSRIAGRKVLFCPDARVEHDYEFDQGPRKWQWLEEGRLAAVLTNFEPRTLLVLSPLLVAVELATSVVAIRDGWFSGKLAAWRTLWRRRRELRSTRRAVRLSRRVPDRELLAEFAPAVDSPALDSTLMRAAGTPQRVYARIVLRLLGG